MSREYSYPVYATQGGGLARYVRDTLIFVESPPNFPNLGVGDNVPEEWDIIAANKAARDDDLEEMLRLRPLFCPE
jgi:hypothetical protein